mmetsp:Transcript_12771/g.21591  ORF Transcript_12771/g.21591 Transcript_12771/m.21591 type:complete len:205 (-) Transcript_12771:601-1215(-)
MARSTHKVVVSAATTTTITMLFCFLLLLLLLLLLVKTTKVLRFFCCCSCSSCRRLHCFVLAVAWLSVAATARVCVHLQEPLSQHVPASTLASEKVVPTAATTIAAAAAADIAAGAQCRLRECRTPCAASSSSFFFLQRHVSRRCGALAANVDDDDFLRPLLPRANAVAVTTVVARLLRLFFWLPAFVRCQVSLPPRALGGALAV